jgi:hypothetical protein
VDVRGQLQVDFATYRRIVVAATGARAWTCRALGLVFFTMGIALLAFTLSTGGPIISAVFCIVGGIMIALIFDGMILLGWRRIASLTQRAWHYEVTDSAIGVHTPLSNVSINWERTRAVRIREDAWVVNLVTRVRLAIPRAAFTAADAERIDALVRSRNGE